MDFNLENFHFSQITWLFGLVIIPIIWFCYILIFNKKEIDKDFSNFADEHLLPHLLISKKEKMRRLFRPLIWLSLIWAILFISLAGPRWDFKEVQAYNSANNLVILLDLSKSMDATDIQPSRLKRAHQEILDILDNTKSLNIGLVAFASVPHLVSPITEDAETIKHFLYSLDTDLISIEGSNIENALKMAVNMFDNVSTEYEANNNILLVSDGGFSDIDNINLDNIRESKINLIVMGVGTDIGAPVPDGNGNWYKKNGATYISVLEEGNLEKLAKQINGLYIRSQYDDKDIEKIKQSIFKDIAIGSKQEKTVKYWYERYYLLIFIILLFLLPCFRKGYAFPAILFITTLLPNNNAYAFIDYQKMFRDFGEYFYNDDQIAKEYYENEDYLNAAEKFMNMYNKAVSYYRNGDYALAEDLFAKYASETNDANALYNLGNSQAMQKKYQEAIESYKETLKYDPEHNDASHNLKILEKILENKERNKPENQDKEESNDKEDVYDEFDNSNNNSDNNQNEEQDIDKKSQSKNNNQSDKSQANQSQTSKPNMEDAGEELSNNLNANLQEKQNLTKDQNANMQKQILQNNQEKWFGKLKNNQKQLLKRQFSQEYTDKEIIGVYEPW